MRRGVNARPAEHFQAHPGGGDLLLSGRIRPDATLFRAAAQAVAEVIEPMDDEGYPPAYRRDVACAMTLRALERTLA